MLPELWERARGRYVRTAARYVFKRPFAIKANVPFISFTFDDFPRSALLTGGSILQRFGLAATYYVSLGLMGKQAPTGAICLPEDVKTLSEQGHELGCHTFDHCDSWETRTSVFVDSIIRNQRALGVLFPGLSFRTFSYPINPPRARTKRQVAGRFVCSRGGGQTFNAGSADLNYLSAYFLEKTREDPRAVKSLIDHNRQSRGWLILATHDVDPNPTPWGCTPSYFEDVVRYAIDSGARILPVVRAWEELRGTSPP